MPAQPMHLRHAWAACSRWSWMANRSAGLCGIRIVTHFLAPTVCAPTFPSRRWPAGNMNYFLPRPRMTARLQVKSPNRGAFLSGVERHWKQPSALHHSIPTGRARMARSASGRAAMYGERRAGQKLSTPGAPSDTRNSPIAGFRCQLRQTQMGRNRALATTKIGQGREEHSCRQLPHGRAYCEAPASAEQALTS